MAEMTKRERLAALASDEATDRPAWSLWRHFYDEESTVEGLVGAMAQWQETYDFDFLKVNPRAQYHVEPWGAGFRYPGGGRKPELVLAPVGEPADWDRIGPKSPTDGALGEQLLALRQLRERLGPDVPMIETIFTPLSIVGDLVATEPELVAMLRAEPLRVLPALEAVTDTFAAFAAECLNAGADGIFFATTEWARRDLLTDEEYARFGRPYDLRVLEAVRDGSFNVLHVCGEHGMLFELADYPVQAVNWAVTLGSTPTLEEACARVPKLLIGGLSHEALAASTPDAALREAEAARGATGGRRWVLGANCTVRPGTPTGTLHALRESIQTGF